MNKKGKIRLLIFLIMAMLVALPGICHAEYASIVVLPLANETGDPSLDWLSLGLQDAISIDLCYASGLNIIDMPQYITVVMRSVDELRSFTKHDAVWLGVITKADMVWLGSFKKQGNEISVELRSIDVRTERETFGLVVSAPADKLLPAESALVVEALETMGFELTPNQRSRILSTKTGSFRAFELNTKGYEVQQELSLRIERSEFYKEWIRLLREAVAEDPEYAEAWINLGWALYTSGDKKGALKAFSNALQLKPYLIDANAGIGFVIRDYKKAYVNAIEHMAKAVELNPGLEWTNRELINTVVQAKDKSALPYILHLLDNERKSIRIAAIQALGQFEDASVLPELGGLINDNDEDVRYFAVTSIGAIGTEAAIPYLEEALKTSKTKMDIVDMIAVISEDAAIPHLIDMLKDTTRGDCIYAAQKLGTLKASSAVPHLIEAMGEFEELSIAAMRALSDIGDISAMPAIIEALKDKRVGVRTVSAAILCDYEAVDASPALWEVAKKDKDPFMRLRALVSLALIGDEEAVSQLAEVVKGNDMEKAGYVTRRILQRPDKFIGTELEFLFSEDDSA